MPIVAVAGGLGDLGKTIAEAIVELKRDKVFIISRKKNPATPSTLPSGVSGLLEIDYADVADIVHELQKYSIDTVISTINLYWPGAPEAQMNLIKASAESGTVTRFVPSEFNIDYSVSEERMPFPPRRDQLQAIEELKKYPQLKWTIIQNGFFMDYLGLPFDETTNLHPLYCVLDLETAQAVIPGNGRQYVAYTHTRDVARFVALLLNAPGQDWPEVSVIVGDKIRLDDLVRLAEEVTERQFTKNYDSVDLLKQNVTTELSSNQTCYPYFPGGKEQLNMVICSQMVGMATGVFDLVETIPESMTASINPTRLRSFLQGCWKKRNGD